MQKFYSDYVINKPLKASTLIAVSDDEQKNQGGITLSNGKSANAPEYSWQIGTDGGEPMSMLLQMMADMNALAKAYQVTTLATSNHFKSSTIGAIKDIFKSAGQFIGELQGGFKVSPAQIGNLVSDMLTSLTEVKSNDFNVDQTDTLFAFEPDEKDPSKAKSIGAVWYHYVAKVKEYKDKKVDEKESNYAVEKKICYIYWC